MEETVSLLSTSGDVLFLMLGAVMVFAMHGGFAFLEVGTVRQKNQVNALVKILCDFGVSALVYFCIGYPLAYGITFFSSADIISAASGMELVRFFFLMTFAAAIPAIISGGIAERAKFWPQVFAAALFVGIFYPLMEGSVWGRIPLFGGGSWLEGITGASFHDFAGSVVVHSFGGWVALVAVLLLGARRGRWNGNGQGHPIPVSNIPMLALGSWMLCVGWFGFNVMSAQSLTGISGLVAMNSLMAMAGGIIGGLLAGRNDPGFIHNGALAGLVAVCAGSDVFHPMGAFIVGGVAAVIFVKGFIWEQMRLKVDDVLGVWPLHGLCGTWGGIACGIFGQKAFGGLGGISLTAQLIGTVGGVVMALAAGFIVYAVLKSTIGIRLSAEEEDMGSDLAVHSIGAYPEENVGG